MITMDKVKIGIIGCGVISEIYLKNLTTMFSHMVEVVACADTIAGKAEMRAQQFHIPKVCTLEQILSDPAVEMIVDLTNPNAHYEICMAALEAGKHVYTEKPLSINRENGLKLIEKAKRKNLYIGGAPDTFLGGGIQTCRRLIDEGRIGKPIAAAAFMTCHGHESWHPNPDFYYKTGGGPVLDMGPYYLTALVNLLGPVAEVKSSAKITFKERTITSPPRRGQTIKVEVPTHVTGILDFKCGAVATLIMSFDIWAANLPRIEIYGTEGSLSVPDPNTFGGKVAVFHQRESVWENVALDSSYIENCRGIGVADMACALRSGKEPRANGRLLYHVLDVMQSMTEASDSKTSLKISSTCEIPRSFNGKDF
jgi:predicted dehydrogenase